MGAAADFFVSYTGADGAWAEWIAWQLEAEGYTVVVQAWDFTPGRDWAHEMQQATATAERVVAVLSTAYLGSAHGEAEWRVFYADDPSGEQGRLLPVRVDKVDPPGLLKTRVYVDLVNKNVAGARAALLAAARGARGKPTEEPRFPGDRRAEVSATEVPRFPGELPPVWNVPFHPNPYFTGRDLLMAELQAKLAAPDMAARRVVLTGLGGVGKTSVAVEYVYKRHADYDLVWCVNGVQPASLLGDLAALAAQLGLAEDPSQDAQVAALRDWLEHHQRWLLVLDNIDDPQQVVELLPRSASGQVVITSRTGVGWESLASVLPVDVLGPTDAAGLLLARAGETDPSAEAAATTLAATLGRLPLALEQAGAYVAASGTVTLAGYAELFATRALELLQRGQPVGYRHTVATTWSLALQQLRATEPGAVELLTLLAFLGPDNLPQPLLGAHHNELPEPLARVARDPLALGDAVAALRRYSLVRVVADGLFVHRLVQAVVRSSLDADAERAWTSAAVRLLRAGFPDDSRAVATWPECERLLPHLLVVADHAQRLDVETEPRLWLLSRAGAYSWSRGQYRQAVTLQGQALAEYQRLLGDDHPTTLGSMEDLAETHWALGDLQGARELHEQALASYRRVFGDDHPDALHALNNLADTLRHLGHLQAARELHQQALTIARRVLGDDHPNTLWSMDSLAATLTELGDPQAARELHEQALAGYRRVLGDDHPETLNVMNSFAETLTVLGELQAARELHEQALAGHRRVLGVDHPDTMWSMSNLAATLTELGDLRAACELYEHVLVDRRRVLGDDHPDTLTAMNNLAAARNRLREL
jgi:tetratricopeptide (TPR) repeat protein